MTIARRVRLSRHTALRSSGGLRRVGRKGRLNRQANRQMAKEFKGTQYCEGRLPNCWGWNWLSWAHHSKRRKLSIGELTIAALLCVPFHQIAERLPAAEMKTLILRIIEERSNRECESA
jgi:hypothetical protein